jgi:hypothetical protein
VDFAFSGGAFSSSRGGATAIPVVAKLHGVGCPTMGRRRKLMDRILSGRSDANIPFEQTVNLLEYLGFDKRINGSHHIFTREDIEELIDL